MLPGAEVAGAGSVPAGFAITCKAKPLADGLVQQHHRIDAYGSGKCTLTGSLGAPWILDIAVQIQQKVGGAWRTRADGFTQTDKGGAVSPVLNHDDSESTIARQLHPGVFVRSVYFRDPEFNGLEVFIDTPWHVRQPQGEPLDLDKSTDEIVAATRAHFATEPEFGPIDEFYRRRAEHIAEH